MERKLAAILAADVVGYSLLMGQDEAGTHAALQEHLDQFVAPQIAQHRGRVVKMMGDGILAEFSSVVDALQCAVAIQRGMAERNIDVPDDQRMQFRIGLNLGDVIADKGDLFGDGVNVAARLEGLAEAGGICISASVHAQVRNKVGVGFEDQGARRVKNIAEPVRAYRVLLEPASKKARLFRHLVWSTGARDAMPIGLIVIVVIVAGVSWLEGLRDADRSAEIKNTPSIAVLPFDNLSGNPDQDYFVDGVTEDIITELSRAQELSIVARTSTFALKGDAIDVGEVSRKLGTRYIVEGSIRRDDNRVQVTVQLVDATTGHHIWAERYDREIDDIFAIQADITSTVAGVLLAEVRTADTRAPTESLRAYDLVKRATAYRRRYTPDDMRLARVSLQQAIDLDPDYAEAHAQLSLVETLDHRIGLTDEPTSFLEGERLAQKAISLNPVLPVAYEALALSYEYQKRFGEALRAVMKTIELNPNDGENWFALAKVQTAVGAHAEAAAAADKGFDLIPDPSSGDLRIYGFTLYAVERHDDAVAALIDCTIRYAQDDGCYLPLAVVLARLNRLDEAQVAMAKWMEHNPKFSLGYARDRSRFNDPKLMAQYLEDLSTAGAP